MLTEAAIWTQKGIAMLKFRSCAWQPMKIVYQVLSGNNTIQGKNIQRFFEGKLDAFFVIP